MSPTPLSTNPKKMLCTTCRSACITSQTAYAHDDSQHAHGARAATCCAQLNGVPGGGTSTQPKLQGLGLNMPDLGAVGPCRAVITVEVVEVEACPNLRSHKSHVDLQLAL